MTTGGPSASPLFRFNRDRNDVMDEVVERVTREALDRAWESPEDGLDYLLNEAAYVEMARLQHSSEPGASERIAMWRDIARAMGRTSEEENAEQLRRIAGQLVGETVGHFRPGVFKLATEVLPAGLSLAFSGSVRPDRSNLGRLNERIKIEGEVGKLRRLAEVGTVVYVPTHSSHLDSIVFTWALHLAELPPVVYGGDMRLFDHSLTAWFMRNLGAYKVNRRRKFRLYRDVVKTYSQVLLEHGYHGMFFPGGMRSRSNAVESELKLGLLSTALDAYTANVLRGRRDAPIYVVPVTLNYPYVLEAPTLIADWLVDAGNRRPIIERDEFSNLRRISSYLAAMMDLGSHITVRFATPVDVFGNAVDNEGRSVDPQGRVVDPVRYLWVDGVPTAEEKRDRAYTRILAGRVAKSYRQNVVLSPIHIVSFSLIEHLNRAHPTWSIERALQFAKGDWVSEAVAVGETERLLRLVRRDAAEGRYRLDREAKTQTAAGMLTSAVQAFERFAPEPVLTREGRRLRLMDPTLLFYYANRLRGHDLERRMGATPGGY